MSSSGHDTTTSSHPVAGEDVEMRDAGSVTTFKQPHELSESMKKFVLSQD